MLDTPPTISTPAASPRAITLSSNRAAGAAGLAWAAILVVTNVVNLAVTPPPDATVDELAKHLTEDRTAIALLTAGFVVGVPLVYWYLTGLARWLARAGRLRAAITGLLAFAGVFTMFGIAAATRLALVASVDAADDSTIWAMWKLHDVTFVLNGAPLAVALLALGYTSAVTGLVPRSYRLLAPAGAILLLTSAAVMPLPIADGTAAAFAPGGLGFLIWLTFVITSSVGLMRQPELESSDPNTP